MWYYFDDHKIYSVTEMDILEQQAYVLFYERYEELLIQELIDELKD
jgi:ubiquitin carboxyl-terminal hydrolase 2/21/ubiquitin carboxyl-terminal hydrolase 8/ubiquitin carboxyl-terminal hydrolase 36/42